MFPIPDIDEHEKQRLNGRSTVGRPALSVSIKDIPPTDVLAFCRRVGELIARVASTGKTQHQKHRRWKGTDEKRTSCRQPEPLVT
jgi:hypothetical protein